MNRPTSLTAAGVATAALLACLASSPAAASAARVDTGRQSLISYNTAFVPAGSSARVRGIYTGSGGTVVTLHVWGLVPNREYGAHAHRFVCGATDPLAAGGHFQYNPDPVQPSVNPEFANPDNEIWLDFTTDGTGSGSAQTVVDWQFPNTAGQRAHSVVIHDHHTATGSGVAGTAGPRYGCLTVAF
ncbi:MAG: superoxide dismutase [Nocardioidaceae bacterium]